MPPNATPERLVVLVLILATVAAACERKQESDTGAKTVLPEHGNRLPAVVPALGIRG